MRVVRATGQNVSPSDDGRLYDQIFSDGLFTDTTFTNLGGNSVQIGAMYGDLCGRDFTIEQMTLTVTLPEGEGEVTGYIYVEIDTSSDDVITLNSALAPFTPTYEDINTNGAIAQMILAEYTATAVAVTAVTPVYERAEAGSVKAGSIATVESAQATQNHAVGDYILLNGQLYVVTAAVNTGETFIEGTNISAAVIGDTLTALNNGLMPFPDYSNGVDIKSSFPTSPTSSTTQGYTFPTDALVFFTADKNSQGFTLFAYVDGHQVAVIPANVPFGGVSLTLPIRKGSELVFKTDSTSETWAIRVVRYYPLVLL